MLLILGLSPFDSEILFSVLLFGSKLFKFLSFNYFKFFSISAFILVFEVLIDIKIS